MRRWRWLGHPLALAAAGSVVLAAGAAIAVALAGITSPPAAGGTPARPAPSRGGPVPSLGALPPLSGSGGRPARQLMIIGRVAAVSRTSITLSGQGHSITAAITRRTRVTGRGGVPAIRAGDTVSAQISETGSPTALAIQDPASVP